MSCFWYNCSLRERRLFPVETSGNWKYVFVGRLRMEFPCPVFWAWVKKYFSCAVTGLGRSSRVKFFFISRVKARGFGRRYLTCCRQLHARKIPLAPRVTDPLKTKRQISGYWWLTLAVSCQNRAKWFLMDEPDIKLLIQTKYTINNRLYWSKGKKFGHVVQSDVCRLPWKWLLLSRLSHTTLYHKLKFHLSLFCFLFSYS